MMLRWRRRDQLRCREVGRLLQSYLDREIDEVLAWRVARHLEDCRRCGMPAETYAEIKRALRRSPGPVPEDAVERLRAFGQTCRRPAPQRRGRVGRRLKALAPGAECAPDLHPHRSQSPNMHTPTPLSVSPFWPPEPEPDHGADGHHGRQTSSAGERPTEGETRDLRPYCNPPVQLILERWSSASGSFAGWKAKMDRGSAVRGVRRSMSIATWAKRLTT